jgi:hypothetical protein
MSPRNESCTELVLVGFTVFVASDATATFDLQDSNRKFVKAG